MKWVNLAERQPTEEGVVIRNIKTRSILNWMYIYEIAPRYITYSDEMGYNQYPTHEYEWLDETSVDEKTMMLPYGTDGVLSGTKVNCKEEAEDWLKSVGISPFAVVDQKVKTFPEEFMRYQLTELLTLYCDHITKPKKNETQQT